MSKIVPADTAIKDAFEQIADHPEIALSRRDILRFILVEPTRRADEVQTILKLDDIGDSRAALNTAQNRVNIAKRSADAHVQASRKNLLTHAQIPTLKADDLLAVINVRRKLLSLSPLDKLGPDTKLDAGPTASDPTPQLNKQSALRDLAALAVGRILSIGHGKPGFVRILHERDHQGLRARCLVPSFDGASLSHDSQEALWDKFYTAAPPRRRQSVEQYKIVKRA